MALRKMTKADLKMVLKWRNTPSVRENMYTSHIIEWDEHKSWFDRIEKDDSCLWCIYEEDSPLGVVCFTNIDNKCRKAFWGFYAGDTNQIGIGMRIAYEAVQFAFDALNLRKLNCEVLSHNKVVINQHSKFGFRQEGLFREEHCNINNGEYINVLRLSIFDYEWKQMAPIIKKRINNIMRKRR